MQGRGGWMKKKESCGKDTIKKRWFCQAAITFFVVLAIVLGFFVFRRIKIVRAVKDVAKDGTEIITYFLLFVVLLLIGITVYVVVMSRRNRKELLRTAFEDALTKLPAKSKHKMDAQELINRNDKKYAYIAFDVENFKYINELFGYEFGNRLLIHIGTVVKRFTKKGELCSRTAGDNFAMLLVYDGDDAALKERLDRIFTAMTEYSEEEIDLNFCAVKYACGVYLIEESEDINKVRANANLARIESKKQLFDKVVFYNEVLKKRHVEERELEYDSKEALGNGEFMVYYQPKYDTGTEMIIGAEALIRWNHPKKGLLPPGTFVPLFEANGFIIELDMFVLRKTCELLSDWIKRGIEPVCISVNLSRTHLYEQNLADRLEQMVQSYQVPFKFIEFELTESAFYEDMSNLLGVMEEIRKKGFRLSMDDFGSGYSSLNLLRRLPVDVLKLDKDFLDGGDEVMENRDKQIIGHVIAMAKDLEMRVLAEGVETAEQRDFLQEARCDIIQGYFFARPMPRQDFEERYLRQSAGA